MQLFFIELTNKKYALYFLSLVFEFIAVGASEFPYGSMNGSDRNGRFAALFAATE